jgi:hypothetical protein
MINPDITQPNFVLLRQNGGKGTVYHVTICSTTLQVLEEKPLSEFPATWSSQDFLDLLSEGRRFFRDEQHG